MAGLVIEFEDKIGIIAMVEILDFTWNLKQNTFITPWRLDWIDSKIIITAEWTLNFI
jgi:hypothetical protein